MSGLWPSVCVTVYSNEPLSNPAKRLVASSRELWVTPTVRPWAQTLRQPTVGRQLILSSYQLNGRSRLLHSKDGRQLLTAVAVRA